MKILDKFKSSQDYIDISYMIDHVRDISVRTSVLQQLGYKVGTLIMKSDLGIKSLTIDKQHKIRMQISNKYKNINIAHCVIIDPKNIYNQKY